MSQKCLAILLDIEGTTTPIEFVHITLFGYARERMKYFIEKNIESRGTNEALSELWKMMLSDVSSGEFTLRETTVKGYGSESLYQYVLWLMDKDSKAGPLKDIEGLIWQEGYRNGELRGEVYPDVPIALKKWSVEGKIVAIYSSGSELSQKLLFSTTEYGDLTIYINRFFDTKIGSKKDPMSYQRIAEEIAIKPGDVLFLSDSMDEIRAASKAGLRSLLVSRDPKQASDGESVVDFSAIC
ncbi:MAG: acireductone synthase [Thermoplasmatales archaeon]